MIILGGDVGGTNIRLALFSEESGLAGSLYEDVLPSRAHTSLKGALREFFSKTDIRPQAAAFVLAGPVVGDDVEITNLEWVAKKSDVREVLGNIPIGFYNDLTGVSNYVPEMESNDLIVLNDGESSQGVSKAVIAPGTGLGEGFLVWDGRGYAVQSSEGGHASFGPEDDLQIELLAFMRSRYEHISYERVCSGSAIPDLYDFIKAHEDWTEPDWFQESLTAAADKTPVIVSAALNPERRIAVCEQVVELFVDILAAEAGNLALKVMALGGVYLAGGMTLKVLPILQQRFRSKFINKGRFSDLLETIPVYVITHPQPALYGAARFGFQLLGSYA